MVRDVSTPKVARKGPARRPVEAPQTAGQGPAKTTSTTLIPSSLLQRLLNTFRDALGPTVDAKLLQEVKGHLYKRDFEAAFGKEEYLDVYAMRWSPSRALGYTDIMVGLDEYLDDIIYSGVLETVDEEEEENNPTTQIGRKPFEVLCLGGGAAEAIAFAGLLASNPQDPPIQLHVTALDIADWSTVVTKLQTSVTSPPILSKYASEAVKAANHAIVTPEELNITFWKEDLLNMPSDVLSAFVEPARLITILFTLNELYCSSNSKTTSMLLDMTSSATPGTLLLVVDSPGSYSTVQIKKDSTEPVEVEDTMHQASNPPEDKRYPMQWLLDHALLGDGKKADVAQWEKLVSDDSRWFRLPSGLRYMIELENMRYQIHLYRRL
jgi:25S rRNA (uracil2843-N3)-methyltransferase